MTLDRLPRNQRRQILAVDTSRAVAQRLMAMGFLPGEPVEIVQTAPFGDPITVDLNGWRVSLRMSEAALIETLEAPAAARDPSTTVGE